MVNLHEHINTLIVAMPSPTVEQYLSSISEEEYRWQVERFQRRVAAHATMSFEEFLEQLVLEDQLEAVRNTDIGRNQRADWAANGVGYVDDTYTRVPCLSKARDPYASVSPYHHGERRGIAPSDYETCHNIESFARGSRGLRAEGRRYHHGACAQPRPFNPYGPAERHSRYSADEPAEFGGCDPHHGDPTPHRLDRSSLGGRSAAQASFAEAISRHHGSRQGPDDSDDDHSSYGG